MIEDDVLMSQTRMKEVEIGHEMNEIDSSKSRQRIELICNDYQVLIQLVIVIIGKKEIEICCFR